jgi:glycerol 2-dehydrogenase (NADP+)
MTATNANFTLNTGNLPDSVTRKHTTDSATGAQIPVIGLGTWHAAPDDAREAVKAALKLGYRHIDTAQAYKNEREVGEGIKESGIPRDQIWVTTKLDHRWHHRVNEAVDQSLEVMGLDYFDLYLMVNIKHSYLHSDSC